MICDLSFSKQKVEALVNNSSLKFDKQIWAVVG